MKKKETESSNEVLYRSAEGYSIQPPTDDKGFKDDVLVIDQNLKGLDFKLAKCCNPIYGDDVFGFVTISGGIKIHREDCPNATEMKARFGYRIVKARWAGKSQGKQYPITLRVVGHDDIGIVTNITNFGCFVDVGIKENGLVHISQIRREFISDPTTIVSIHQHVQVKVLSIDRDRKRIQLTMILD